MDRPEVSAPIPCLLTRSFLLSERISSAEILASCRTREGKDETSFLHANDEDDMAEKDSKICQ